MEGMILVPRFVNPYHQIGHEEYEGGIDSPRSMALRDRMVNAIFNNLVLN
jgi:hypothetical protein